MTGCFRRAIRLRSEPGSVSAEIEDDFHHFAVSLQHDGERVTEVRGRAYRHPWSRCPMAASALPAFRGLALTTDPTAAYRHLDPRLQCTHMFEVAALAVAHAARGMGERRYDISVTNAVNGRSEAELLCDGVPVARWVLQDGVIVEPAAQAGQRPAAYQSRALAALPPDEAEALLMLRRAVVLGGARGRDIDRYPTAAELPPGPVCFVYRPGVAEHAKRQYGSERDFSTGPGPLNKPPPSGENA